MRLIDADALYEAIMTFNSNELQKWCYPCDKILQEIKDAPTIDPNELDLDIEYSIKYEKRPDGISNATVTITKAELSKLYKEFYEQGKYDAEVERAFTEPSADRPKGEPETEPAPVVAYICDRRRCAICGGPDGGCDHTTDIKHAAHFKNVAGQYFERPYMEDEDDG